jgi:glycosyltransferase involved in cell wall biosynthesis
MYSTYSIIVCGCTKNSSSYIYKHLESLYEMHDQFAQFKLLVFENNSTDNTVEILETFKKTHPFFNYISEKNNIGKRSQAIAHGRNTLLQHVKQYDYMIMVDLDDVIATFKSRQIKYLFENTKSNDNDNDNPNVEWDALFANCLGKYYDVWALRIYPDIWNNSNPFKMIDYDCWDMARLYQSKRIISIHQITIPTNLPLIPVSSAFGGFGIYKVSKIKDCRYDGTKCEHVHFHKEMIEKNNAKLFICPKFLVNRQDQHIV